MTTNNQLLLIRVDASPHLGIGHVMRCLALAQTWCDAGGRAAFLAVEMPATLTDRLRQEGMQIGQLSAAVGGDEDAIQTAALARESGAAWIVADGYDFSQRWQQIAKDKGARLLLLDDDGRIEGYCADLILDSNPRARPELHSASQARLLLGPRYVLLRREFLRWRDWERETSRAHRVLITLGGADADNVTLRVLRALDRINDSQFEVTLLIGPANPHRRDLETFVARARHRIALKADAPDVAVWMAWADIAIAAGGTTTWERAFMGLPGLTLMLADNQSEAARAAEEAGLTCNLGWHGAIDDNALSHALRAILADGPARARAAQRGRELVDGYGVERLLMHMTGAAVRLRPVREADVEMLWRWANDPVVRRASLSESPIPWDAHVNWFSQKRQEPGCLMFVGVDADDALLGHVRIERRADDDAAIHINVAGERRGQGWGAHLIRAAVARACRELKVRRVHARIKPDNPASLRAFEKAGFRDIGLVIQGGQRVRQKLYIHEETR